MRKPMKFIASSLLLVGFGLIGSSILFGRGKGVIEGEFQIPKNVTKAFPACGQAQCHGTGFPNERGVVKILIKTSASIQLGAKSPLTATLTGGVKNSTKGGFSMDTDLGTFTAGIGTRTGNSNQSITHNSSASRTWTFTFSSTKTGLAQLTMVGNTVDGNGRNSGDSWAWYGPNSNLPGTPFRIFVNDSKVLPYGSACAGTKEFAPLIGIRKNAALGQTTTVEAYNLPPAVPVMNILGFSNTSFGAIPLPLDLGFLGAKGCSLRASLDLNQVALSKGTGAGNGSASFAWPIPNLSSLRGLNLYFQALVFDKGANGAGLTTTMGLKATIQ
ncbi:MAG TPA: hypothetical protein ENK02_08260 [Planctomycetes bacterium]|nr:hypothetical protein [Planctomycetota bacterium]